MSVLPFEAKVDYRFLIVAGVLIVGAVWYQRKMIGEAAEVAAAVLQSVNPLNQNNVIAEAANGVGEAVTGEDGWTLGGATWELGHFTTIDPATGAQVIKENIFGAMMDAVTGVN